METEVRCPSCGSTSFFAHKKGYSAGKGCVGGCLTALIFFPIAIIGAIIGLLWGQAGANKIQKTCNNCGHTW